MAECEMQESKVGSTMPESFPRRPTKPAQCGKKIPLVSNCFPVEVASNTLFHYDVEINQVETLSAKEKDKTKKFREQSMAVNRKVINVLFPLDRSGVFGDVLPAFDGRKNLYTVKALNIEANTQFSTKIQVNREDGKPHTFKVTIKLASLVNTETLLNLYTLSENLLDIFLPQDVIAALDIVFRHGPTLVKMPLGRSIFYEPDDVEQHSLSGGKEIWSGYYQSLRPGQWLPMLTVDKSNAVFYSPKTLIQYVEDFCGKTINQLKYLSDYEVNALSRDLKGVQIRVTHQDVPRQYRVVRLVRERPCQISMRADSGYANVEHYFLRKYNKQLRYPNLPCLQLQPESKCIYMPLEMCEIVPKQPFRGKLSDSQLIEMIRKAKIEPRKRFEEIQRSLEEHLVEGQPWLEEFGIKVDTTPMKVDGRVLDAPALRYGTRGDTPVEPCNGAWTMKEEKFLSSVNLKCWVVITLFKRLLDNDGMPVECLRRYIHRLIQHGRQAGMDIAQPLNLVYCQPYKIEDTLKIFKEKYNIDLAFVILESKDVHYAQVKKAGDSAVGVMTQCTVANNVIDPNLKDAYFFNILQKMNTKLGGKNHAVASMSSHPLLTRPMMVIGVDVSHPVPYDYSSPSVAAAVATMDRTMYRYIQTLKIQQESGKWKARVELIKEFKEMIKELLDCFHQLTKKYPEKIIIYRDGVSGGQFLDVRNHEVSAVRLACLEIVGPNYEPGITFVVVQKNHHVRFRPENNWQGVGKCRNVPPGTTVDTMVTHPTDNDFYLNSHFCTQGTSKPCHYYVLWDDNRLSADELQNFTYHLCHVYARCTSSISCPVPVKYAHLAAVRARNYLKVRGEKQGSGDSFLQEDVKESILVHPNLKNTMNFV